MAKQLCYLEGGVWLVYLFGFVLHFLSSDLSLIMLFESGCLGGIRSLVSSDSLLPVSLTASSSLLLFQWHSFQSTVNEVQ